MRDKKTQKQQIQHTINSIKLNIKEPEMIDKTPNINSHNLKKQLLLTNKINTRTI